jgi:hypothetical protein
VIRVVVMIVVVGVAGFALAIGVICYLVVRGSKATTITRENFDQTYDELLADGEVVESEREANWRDFDAWQLRNKVERLPWEEASDE